MSATLPSPVLRARQFATSVESLTDMVMFAPGGVHTLTPSYGGASVEVTIKVDEATAAVLNASLAQLNTAHAPQRAFIDRNHEGKEAMAWPKMFVWSETPQPGVYVAVEWSSLGEEYVRGKVMRAFSGSFFTDAELPKKPRPGQHIAIPAGRRGSKENPARIVGLGFPDAGTLTNDPAFRKILPLWAKHAGATSRGQEAAPSGSSQTTTTINMKLTPEQKAALQASIQTLEQELPTLRAQHAANPNDAGIAEQLQQKETELESAKAKLQAHELATRNEELEQALLAQRTKDADAAIQAAIQRGAIAARDTATQDAWRQKLIQDPATNLPLLQAMRGSPALQSRITTSGIVVTREDSVTVLRAYNQERDPRRKGQIYAREISKRIRDGEDLPIHAANLLGTLSGEIVTQRTLELLLVEQPMMAALSTDFSPEAAKLNQDVTSRIVGIPGTSAYDPGNGGYQTENTVLTDVTVTINQHKSCQVSFNANELASTSRRLFDELAPAMSYAIGKDFIDAALAVITAANFTEAPTVEAEIDFDRGTVIKIGGALDDRGVPKGGRTLLLKGSYYDRLFSDPAIVTLAGNQRQDLITGDRMIPVHGFNVVRTATLPATDNLAGFGFSKSAIVVAGRVPSDYANALPGATGGGTSQVITEPNSGLSVHLVQFVDHKAGAAFARMAYLFGAAKGQIKAGQRLTSA